MNDSDVISRSESEKTQGVKGASLGGRKVDTNWNDHFHQWKLLMAISSSQAYQCSIQCFNEAGKPISKSF